MEFEPKSTLHPNQQPSGSGIVLALSNDQFRVQLKSILHDGNNSDIGGGTMNRKDNRQRFPSFDQPFFAVVKVFPGEFIPPT